MKTKLYKINPRFAKREQIPAVFAGVVLRETAKAVYLYGHGTIEAQTKFNVCCRCGKTLSHPGSMKLGIGPECLGDWGLREAILKTMTEEEVKQTIRKTITSKTVDQWIPKSCIQETAETNEKITPPKNHPKLNEKPKEIKKQAELLPSKTIEIRFPFNPGTVQQVKTLTGRKYHKDTKTWTVPLKIESVERLKEWGFELDKGLIEFLNNSKVNINELKEINIPGLKEQLRPFQKKGVAFLEARKGRGLIADEMGLGKTVQALAWLQLHEEKRPAIIVCPASLKLNWAKETCKWLKNPRITVLSGTKPYTIHNPDIVILNYDILSYWVDAIRGMDPQILVADECHYFKNNKAKRTKAIKQLGKSIPHIICLSGTPIVNRPVEIYNAIALIDSTIIPSYWHYVQRYCGARHTGFGWDFNGASNTEELHQILSSTIMIRRLKKDVLTELPEKIRTIVPIEINNWKEYNKAKKDFLSWLGQNKGQEAVKKARNAETLTRIEGLKQISVKGKLSLAIDWIRNFIESDGKLVVFAVHKFVIDALMQEFKGTAVKIDGTTPHKERQEAVDRFQTDPKIKLFVGNIKAAGVGITLTAASSVAFLELPWTPGELIQAEDRCHRIGQKNAVNVYYLIGTETIEEQIAELIDEKRKILDSVLDGTVTDNTSLLSELINLIKEENDD